MRCQKTLRVTAGVSLRLALCNVQGSGGQGLASCFPITQWLEGWGLSNPSAHGFFVIINRKVPSAYYLDLAGQFEQNQKRFLPLADSLRSRPYRVQADCVLGWPPRLGPTGRSSGPLQRPQLGSEPVAVATVTPPTHAAQLLH